MKGRKISKISTCGRFPSHSSAECKLADDKIDFRVWVAARVKVCRSRVLMDLITHVPRLTWCFGDH